MKFKTNREALLRPITLVNGVVERRQTLPILGNVLVEATKDELVVRGTDLEVELEARVGEGIDIGKEGTTTIPAHKLADIWRSLPESSDVDVEMEKDHVLVRSGRTKFKVSTLPSDDFPSIESGTMLPDEPKEVKETTIEVSAANLRRLLKQTSFAMAQQDVRFFLNGLLFELTDEHLRTVATDGHRLAMCTLDGGVKVDERVRVIVPRKGVLELGRLIGDSEEDVTLTLTGNLLRATQGAYSFATKLVDGQFPEYSAVIPSSFGHDMVGNKDAIRQALQRVAILSNEQYHEVRLKMESKQVTLRGLNAQAEEAEEVVEVAYNGEALEVGFNVGYLQDVLSVLETDDVKISMPDGKSSALIEAPEEEDSKFVVMPMRL